MSLSKTTYNILAVLLLIGFATALTGCQPDKTTDDEPVPTADVSDVPLRIWVVTQLSDPALFKRQWLADSDQPIEITSMTEEDFLTQPSCKCDVVLVPARHLGELLQREWMIPLPSSVYAPPTDEMETNESGESSTHIAQVMSGGERFGVPLGCSLPVVIASAAMVDDVAQDTIAWPALIERLVTSNDKQTVADSEIDRDALVDRFLSLVGLLSDRNSQYGLLFELKTMNSRLKEAEFIKAAEILVSLSQQPGGKSSVIGSHDTAWRWACENPEAVIAIASPALLSEDSAALKSGGIVQMKATSDVQGWNAGSGIIAGLSSECRQTSRAARFLKWLRQSATQDALAPLMIGVETNSAAGKSDSLSWSARKSLENVLHSKNVPQEPCLPRASQYRQALAEGLLRVLENEVSIPQMLTEVDAAWSKITAEAGKLQRFGYEKSLGLTL